MYANGGLKLWKRICVGSMPRMDWTTNRRMLSFSLNMANKHPSFKLFFKANCLGFAFCLRNFRKWVLTDGYTCDIHMCIYIYTYTHTYLTPFASTHLVNKPPLRSITVHPAATGDWEQVAAPEFPLIILGTALNLVGSLVCDWAVSSDSDLYMGKHVGKLGIEVRTVS